MNKKFWLGLGIVVLVVIIAIATHKKTDVNQADKSITTSAPLETTNPNTGGAMMPGTDSGTSSSEKTFTLAQVATHNTEADCYAAINGTVYDLTAWIHKHPGGDRAILSICGKDGSAAFNGQHSNDTKPKQILAGFEVGTLSK
jgi:cytochrome b involved in lipid metabolism